MIDTKKLRWMGAGVLIEPMPMPSDSSIILPKLGQTVIGRVVCVGMKSGHPLKAGDAVIYRKTNEDSPEGAYLEVRDEDILAVVEN